MATLWKCVAEPSGNPPGAAHALRTHARTHAPAIKSTRLLRVVVVCNEAVPLRPYCAGVATRTRNVSEYMLVLALCLVDSCVNDLKLGKACGPDDLGAQHLRYAHPFVLMFF